MQSNSPTELETVTEEQQKKLRQYFHSLRGQLRVLEEPQAEYQVQGKTVHILGEILQRLERDFPGLVPQFSANNHFSFRGTSDDVFDGSSLRAHVASVLGIIEVELDDQRNEPVIQTKDFSFITDKALRSCLERDYAEIQRAFVAQCWKSTIILSGGAIEAILADLLMAKNSLARSSSKAPKGADITRWELAKLIDVAVDLKLVSPGVEKLSHSVREYRNLIHPGNEIRTKLTFGREEARIAIEVLHILYRDLSP